MIFTPPQAWWHTHTYSGVTHCLKINKNFYYYIFTIRLITAASAPVLNSCAHGLNKYLYFFDIILLMVLLFSALGPVQAKTSSGCWKLHRLVQLCRWESRRFHYKVRLILLIIFHSCHIVIWRLESLSE